MTIFIGDDVINYNNVEAIKFSDDFNGKIRMRIDMASGKQYEYLFHPIHEPVDQIHDALESNLRFVTILGANE
jgi:hypothetical protein